jgi:hypothetical protein
MYVYGIKQDPMVHGMQLQIPEEKKKKRKRPRKRCINNVTVTDQRKKK